jgi:hypothetical protein
MIAGYDGFGLLDDFAANPRGPVAAAHGLPNGRYELVPGVNADRRLRERDYSNDAASVMLSLLRRRGVPRLAVLASRSGHRERRRRGLTGGPNDPGLLREPCHGPIRA